jgi:hypothetical protein
MTMLGSISCGALAGIVFKGIVSHKRRMTMLGSISCGGLAGTGIAYV